MQPPPQLIIGPPSSPTLPSRYWRAILSVADDEQAREHASAKLRSLHDRTSTKTNARGLPVASYKVIAWARTGNVYHVSFRQAAGYTLSALKKNVVNDCGALLNALWQTSTEREVNDAVRGYVDDGQPGEQGRKRKKHQDDQGQHHQGFADEDEEDPGASAGASSGAPPGGPAATSAAGSSSTGSTSGFSAQAAFGAGGGCESSRPSEGSVRLTDEALLRSSGEVDRVLQGLASLGPFRAPHRAPVHPRAAPVPAYRALATMPCITRDGHEAPHGVAQASPFVALSWSAQGASRRAARDAHRNRASDQRVYPQSPTM